jgi:transposase
MIKIELSAEELDLLKRYIRTTSLVLIRLKSQAILMRSKGMGVSDIGDIVSRDSDTVSKWLGAFVERRMASIFSGHSKNENASKLTREQKEEIKKALANPPSEYGLPKEFWDVPTLKGYIEAKFDIVYASVQSYHFLLKFSNLSFKYPDTCDRHRDEAYIEKRVNEIRNEIKPFLEDEGWEVFASDEVRIELEAFTRRAWLKKGERTVVKVERRREAQSYIGLLNQKTGGCHLYALDWQNQDEILPALEQFLKEYPEKKICIVWDNVRFHKGKKIQEALQTGGILERVHLINFPPYAPDTNPIEHVWNTAKNETANIQQDTLEHTKEAFTQAIQSKTFHYQI